MPIKPESGVRSVTDRVMVDLRFGAADVRYSSAASLQWQQWMDRVNRHRSELPEGVAPVESILVWVTEVPEAEVGDLVAPVKARPGVFATWRTGQSILVYDRHWGMTRHTLLQNADVGCRVVELAYDGQSVPALELTTGPGSIVVVGPRAAVPGVILDRFNCDIHVGRMNDLITGSAAQ